MGNSACCCYDEENNKAHGFSDSRSLHKAQTFVNELRKGRKNSKFGPKNVVTNKKYDYSSDHYLINNSRYSESGAESVCKTEDNTAVRTYFAKLATSKSKKSNFSRRVSIVQTIQMKNELSNKDF